METGRVTPGAAPAGRYRLGGRDDAVSMPRAKKEDHHERSAPGLTRRVQRTGSSSLSITLPKSWTDSMNLQTGDVLRFRDLGEGRLEISQANAEAPGERRQRLLKIDATDVPPNLLVRLPDRRVHHRPGPGRRDHPDRARRPPSGRRSAARWATSSG